MKVCTTRMMESQASHLPVGVGFPNGGMSRLSSGTRRRFMIQNASEKRNYPNIIRTHIGLGSRLGIQSRPGADGAPTPVLAVDHSTEIGWRKLEFRRYKPIRAVS